MIIAGAGINRVNAGSGRDKVHAVNGRVDSFSCGAGLDCRADHSDRVAGSCEHVQRTRVTGSPSATTAG